MVKILIADKLDQSVVQDLQAKENVQVDVKPGLSEDQLSQIVGQYDGMIIRSGVTVTAKVLEHPGQLRAVARAGVGVDNVDLSAATKAGVLVMNTPDANTISTAEHTFGMLLALARNIPQSHIDTKAGNWNRNKFVGKQLAGKLLGLVGLGRVGRAVAERALSFKMTVWAYDPLFPEETALDGKVKVVRDLGELLSNADFISLHAPVTDQTKKMIGADQLAKMKPSALLINCARGELVDEDALAEALKNKKIAGAAVDVFSAEPPGKLALFDQENAIVTCHLGASTKEAQLAVSKEAVQVMLDYLQHGTIAGAVNVPGLPASLTSKDRSFVDLVQRMACLAAPLVDRGIKSVQVTATSHHLERVLPLLLRSVLVKLLGRFLETPLNVINAELAAASTGIQIAYSTKTSRSADTERIAIDIAGADYSHRIEGGISPDGLPTILDIDGYRMQMVPEGTMIIQFNDDQPGVIGLVGTLFGAYKVNIADMTLSRRENQALMVFKIDAPPPAQVIDQLKKSSPPIRFVAHVDLPKIDGVRPTA
ncbi:MAG: phosphoglycerate dehydrogenase [Phycisphaerae bacterium]